MMSLFKRNDYGVDTSSPSIKQINSYFEQHKMNTLLPYRSYDPIKQIFHNENSVGFVFETYPLVGCTEAMQREISSLFQQTLPEGSNLQFILWADPRVQDVLSHWESAREHQGEVLRTLAKRRANHLGGLAFNKESGAPLRNLRCIISYSQNGSLDNPVEEDKFNQLKSYIKTALETLGVPVKQWSADDLLNTLDGILNFNQDIDPADLKWNPYDSLSQQIPVSGNSLQIKRDHILLNDESVIKNYSIRREPDHWSLHAMGDLIGDAMRDMLQIPCPYLIHYGIHVPSQNKTSLRVQSRESWVERQARSKIGKRIPILVKQARELDFVRQQQSKGERFVETSFTISLMSNHQQIDQADHAIKNLFRSNRWEIKCDQFIQLPNLISMLPMCWGEGVTKDLRYLQKLKTTLSSESANLLPLQGEWRGTQSPGMLLAGRRGQVFTWSPFDNNEGNYNVAVVGKSGSGKSVFMQELAASTLGIGGQVFVLDVGRSFEKTVKILNGEYLEFTPHNPICINPFTNIADDGSDETEDALAMLKPILALMAAPTDGTNDLENSFIEQGIKAAWNQKKNNASISDVQEYLLNHDDAIAKSLGQKLFPYSKEGIYGRFFNGPATVDLAAKMVVVELEELKERKDLQAVIVQMVILQITTKLYLGDRKTPSNVILDEAWDMLRGEQSGAFIETAARRLRKYGGSLVVGTQSVNDFYITPAAQVAFENCDWMCLLAQKAESIKQLKSLDRIDLDPAMEKMLSSVQTKQGQYAEVMIYGPHGYAIGRLFLDPYSLILYSTKADEFAAVQTLVQQGMTMADAVAEVSRRAA